MKKYTDYHKINNETIKRVPLKEVHPLLFAEYKELIFKCGYAVRPDNEVIK